MTAHILANFEEGLRDLRSSVLTMGSVTQRNLEHVCRGLIERNSDFCNEAISDDDEVDDFERRVDREGMEVILKFAPVATDLRSVLGSMRIATNLERVSDQAVNIGRRARKLNKHPEVAITKTIEPLFQTATEMVKDSIRAFSETDTNLAADIINRDPELDDQHNALIKQLTSSMEADRDNIRTFLHLTFIVRFIERIGDHAVNIAEDVIFIKKGSDIRHVDKKGRAHEAASL